ncbi:MAG TPA: hypothetical protein VM238_17285 [Phycisphaerae bacterium]|nr:hypothetical protein [Phycisphaerae bacterium]
MDDWRTGVLANHWCANPVPAPPFEEKATVLARANWTQLGPFGLRPPSNRG